MVSPKIPFSSIFLASKILLQKEKTKQYKYENLKYPVKFSMNSGQSITALESNGLHVVIVVRRVAGVAPGQQDQLAVAVDGVVEHKLVLH